MENEIRVPIIILNGVDQEGNSQYLVTVYNRGLQTLANGVNRTTALEV